MGGIKKSEIEKKGTRGNGGGMKTMGNLAKCTRIDWSTMIRMDFPN